jgi:hypothetical protein
LNASEESQEGGTVGKRKKTKIGVHKAIRDQRLVATDGLYTTKEIEEQFRIRKWQLNFVC